MKNNDTISFTQASPKKRKRLPQYVVFIIFACAIFGIVSFTVLLYHNGFDIEKTLGLRQSEVEETTEGTTAQNSSEEQDFSGSINFLFICENEKEITFCEIISVSPSSSKIRIKPVATNTLLDTENGAYTLSELYKNSTVVEICAALSKKYSSITRYVSVTENNFVKLMRKLGPIEITTDRDYEYNVDNIKYTFTAGKQTVTAEMLLNFMKFAESGDELLKLQANAAAAVIRTHFTAEKLSRGEYYFSELINLVSGNITAFDYNSAKNIIDQMAKTGVEVTVIS